MGELREFIRKGKVAPESEDEADGAGRAIWETSLWEIKKKSTKSV